MDIKIPHSWLLEYVHTTLKPKALASLVSLGGPSIDRVHEANDESIYDVEITTNRPDAFSVYGFAREVAALLQVPFSELMNVRKLEQFTKKVHAKAKKFSKNSISLNCTIQDRRLCNRYCASIMNSVTVGPSPVWMKERLELMGLRSINNVVDITNYVMLEYGQPLHAFDADLIDSGSDTKHIVVRKAKNNESFETLDGEVKKLLPHHLLIADSKKALALAGIKGGMHAGITSKTRTVILESANFNPVHIRTSSRELQLRTDASVRFEKGLSPQLAPFALLRAMELLEKYAGGIVASPIIDTYPTGERPKKVAFSLHDYKRIVGVPITLSRTRGHLEHLGFRFVSPSSFEVPFWRRADIDNSLDLVEEVARMQRYSELPREQLRGSLSPARSDHTFTRESMTKHFLRDLGWTECMTYSLISKKMLDDISFNPQKTQGVINPLSLDFSLLRPSLLPGMMAVLAENEQKGDEIKLFELGTLFSFTEKLERLPQEKLSLVLVYAKKKATNQELFLALKGICEDLLHEWSQGLKVEWKKGENDSFFDHSHSSRMVHNAQAVGTCGLPHKKIASSLGIKIPFGVVEIDLAYLMPFITSQKQFVPLPKYPNLIRDIAFVVEKNIPFGSLKQTLESLNPLITDVELFDLFEHATLGKSRKSLALHITYQSFDKTLTAQEVDGIHDNVRKVLQEKFQADIRS